MPVGEPPQDGHPVSGVERVPVCDVCYEAVEYEEGVGWRHSRALSAPLSAPTEDEIIEAKWRPEFRRRLADFEAAIRKEEQDKRALVGHQHSVAEQDTFTSFCACGALRYNGRWYEPPTARAALEERLDALTKAVEEEVDERERLEHLLDQFAAAIAPIEVIGEHSSMNNPWHNSLDYLIDWKARAERAEDALETIQIQAVGVGYEVAHAYFGALIKAAPTADGAGTEEGTPNG